MKYKQGALGGFSLLEPHDSLKQLIIEELKSKFLILVKYDKKQAIQYLQKLFL